MPSSEHSKDSDFDANISTILRALEAAVVLGKVAELARVVKPWMDGQLVAGVRSMPAADQAREDVIDQLHRSLEDAPLTRSEGGHE